VKHSVSREVKHHAFSLAGRVARTSADHLLPKAAAEGVPIQHHKINGRNVHTFGKDRVVAQHPQFPAGKCTECLGAFVRVCVAVHAGGSDAGCGEPFRQLLGLGY
jgi:hypothetical protein